MKIWIQIFGWPAPQKFGGGKNVQNLVQFGTTLDFDREYLWNESRYQKSEKQVVINYNPSTLDEKMGELVHYHAWRVG